jgi:hypothetical protein
LARAKVNVDREKQSILAVIARDLFSHGPADDLDDRMIWSMAGDVHVAAFMAMPATLDRQRSR